jgi:hypothetical protein
VSKEQQEPTKTDLAHIDRIKDENIDYSDIPPLDESFFTRPTVPHDPDRYRALNTLPPSMLDWLKQ